MEGFYSKDEAARILGVSVRQISNYLRDDRVRRVVQGRRVFIPKEDVERLYNGIRSQIPASPEEFQKLQTRVLDLEHSVEVLKGGLGISRRSRLRNDSELLLFRQRCVDSLSKRDWTPRKMLEMADELMRVQDAEVGTLVRKVGPAAWVPFCELATRMLSHIEADPDFPERGLELLHTRLLRGRDRFYGLIHAATKTTSALPPPQARTVERALELPIGLFESHITAYVMGTLRAPWG